MKRKLIILTVIFAAVCTARPLIIWAITDFTIAPVTKLGFEDPNQIVGEFLGTHYAIKGQEITFQLPILVNDPNLDYEIIGPGTIVGQTVTWSGPRGIHYLFFELRDKASLEVEDAGTVAIKCLPRGQFKGVVWE
jgi:hypothetical protein